MNSEEIPNRHWRTHTQTGSTSAEGMPLDLTVDRNSKTEKRREMRRRACEKHRIKKKREELSLIVKCKEATRQIIGLKAEVQRLEAECQQLKCILVQHQYEGKGERNKYWNPSLPPREEDAYTDSLWARKGEEESNSEGELVIDEDIGNEAPIILQEESQNAINYQIISCEGVIMHAQDWVLWLEPGS